MRTLIEAEIASRDAFNTRARLKAAAFSVIKTIKEFDLSASSIPAPTFAYLTSLEWIGAKENLAVIGPAGTGKSHTLIALGHAAVHAGHQVRYFTAPDLVDTLYRGLADNSVGKTIDTMLRNDLVILDEVGFAPLDDTGTQLLFRLVAAAYERRSLAIASHWSFRTGAGSSPNTPQPSASWTGCCTTPPPWSPAESPTGCARPELPEEDANRTAEQPQGWGLLVGHHRGLQLGH